MAVCMVQGIAVCLQMLLHARCVTTSSCSPSRPFGCCHAWLPLCHGTGSVCGRGGWRLACRVSGLVYPPPKPALFWGAPFTLQYRCSGQVRTHGVCASSLGPWYGSPGTCVCISVSMGYGRCCLSPRRSLWVFGHSFQPLMLGHTLQSMTCNVSTCLLACERSAGVHFSLCPSIALVVTSWLPQAAAAAAGGADSSTLPCTPGVLCVAQLAWFLR